MTLPRSFTLFKAAIYTLLAGNIVLFFRHATFHEGIDSIGWVVLLAAFEWDSHAKARPGYHRWLRVVEMIAYALILYAWGKYFLHQQWLDFLNASLWLGVIALITIDLYFPAHGWLQLRAYRFLKVLLYLSLVALAIHWGLGGDILNFYDAFLWIVCFFAIEMNLLQRYFNR